MICTFRWAEKTLLLASILLKLKIQPPYNAPLLNNKDYAGPFNTKLTGVEHCTSFVKRNMLTSKQRNYFDIADLLEDPNEKFSKIKALRKIVL